MSEKIFLDCYQICNKRFNALDPKRLFCKKGCDSDSETLNDCKNEDCQKLCIKEELGEDESKLGAWSKLFQRAPTDPTECLQGCYFGCINKDQEEE